MKLSTVQKTAYNLLRRLPPYPFRVVDQGIFLSGDMSLPRYRGEPGSGHTALLTWNNYGNAAKFAAAHKATGGRHICLENGYLPHANGNARTYAWEFDGYGGAGWTSFHNMPATRFEQAGIQLRGYTRRGRHILVCGQRGGAYSKQAMPDDWPAQICERIRALTGRPIVYRPHPEARKDHAVPAYVVKANKHAALQAALQDAWAVVVYCSNAATIAVQHGVPVFYDGPCLKVAPLALRGVTDIENPLVPDDEQRRQVFYDLVWSNWTADELKSGVPWRLFMHAQ